LILRFIANAYTTDLSWEASLQIADHVSTDFAALVNIRLSATVVVFFFLLIGGSRFHLCGEVINTSVGKILRGLGL
jgi:hypothetical protein